MARLIPVFDLDGLPIANAESFGEARELHEQWLSIYNPRLLPLYAGVSTNTSTFGEMLFVMENAA